MQTETTAPQKVSRLLFVDIFRGFITLVMLEGHVTNSTMLPSIKITRAFHYINLFNGMIAPSFIFIAGFAISMALHKKWDSFLKYERPLWLQIRRLLFILGVGYWLHLPTWSFRSFLNLSGESMLYFLRCDVLQLISLSLLLILLLALVIRHWNALAGLLLILALFNVLVTPFLYETDPRRFLPVPFSDWINVSHGALFPLFPWSAYAFLGSVTCWLFLRVRETGHERNMFFVMFLAGAIMFAGAFALFYVPLQYHAYADPSRSSPRHFMLKMGFIFLLLPTLWFYEQIRKPGRSLLNIVGQESLMVYGLHLVFVYGASFTPYYISRDVGPTLTYIPSFTISFILIISMIAAAFVWHDWKAKSPRSAKWFFYALCAIYFFRFFAT